MRAYVSVIGGMNLDLKGIPFQSLLSGTSNPGKVYSVAGGVGRNIAHNLALLEVPVYLFGAVGDDLFGAHILRETQQAGVDTTYVRVVPQQQTGLYLSILDDFHDLAVAVSDMDISNFVDHAYLQSHQDIISNSSFIVAETNLTIDTLAYILDLSNHARIPCLLEPVSVEKANKLRNLEKGIDYITPNRTEVEALCQREILSPSQLEAACAQLSRKYRHILVTLGEDGVYSYCRNKQTGNFYPACKTQVVDVTGAGDAFVAGVVCGLFRNFDLEESISLGMAVANLTLQAAETVSSDLTFELCLSLATKPRSHEKERR